METAPPPRKPWYRRLAFRISVRTLIVLVLVMGGGLGWIGHRARVQRQAVAAIEKAGGSVGYDFEWFDRNTDPSTLLSDPWPFSDPWPKWLVDAVGTDYLSNVVTVSFPYKEGGQPTDDLMVKVGRLSHLKGFYFSSKKNGAVTDAGVAHLSELGRLRELSLSGNVIKGPGLVCLEGMTDLRVLDLSWNPLHDADMAHLSRLSRLEVLNLRGLAVTDAGLGHLKRLNLRDLDMNRCPITTAGLAHLRGMNRLEFLWVMNTQVDSLKPLRSLRNLTNLGLAITPITNEGLAPVANFARLKSLHLDGTSIGDAGLVHLRGLTNLTELYLAETKITDAGLANLAGLWGSCTSTCKGRRSPTPGWLT
jgi:internalin A